MKNCAIAPENACFGLGLCDRAAGLLLYSFSLLALVPWGALWARAAVARVLVPGALAGPWLLGITYHAHCVVNNCSARSLRTLVDSRSLLSIISLYASRLRDLRNGPRAGRSGPGALPVHFAVGLRGTWPTLAQALGLVPCALGQTTSTN